MRLALALAVIAAAPAFAGYASKATVSFAAATGSTQTNITLAFTFSDPKLATVANGGQIQNTVTRVGVVVPADFALTNDTTCGTITGWTWGIETYSATAGTGIGWAKVSSLTAGAAVTPTVCVGNAAVTTYQGGAQGAEFDANTLAAYHLPDGTTLSVKDFSGNANDGTNSGGTAVAGTIDGAVSLNGSTASVALSTANSYSGSFTFEAWVELLSNQGPYTRLLSKESSNNAGLIWVSAPNATGIGIVRADSGGSFDQVYTSALSLNTFYHLVGTYDGTTLRSYLDAVSQGSTPSSRTLATNANPLTLGSYAFSSTQEFNGVVDELRISSTARSADWIATEYANQLAPPAVSALTALATSSPRLLLLGVAE